MKFEVLRAKLLWRVLGPVIGLGASGLLIQGAQDGAATLAVMSIDIFAISSWYSRITIKDKIASHRGLFRKTSVDLDSLAVVELGRKANSTLTPFPLILALEDKSGSRLRLETAFWSNWRSLAREVAYRVETQPELSKDPKTFSRLAALL